MLTFLTGCDAGAKREYIANELVKAAQAGKKPYLIVPDQESFERDRELLFKYGERVSNKITVAGFVHFAREILEKAGLAVKPEADEAALSVFMSLALKEVSDELKIFSGHYRRPANVHSLISAYESVKRAGADSGTLFSLCPRLSGRLREKTGELALIFSAFDALVTDRFSSSDDNIIRACGVISENGAETGSVYWFDDFRGFTGVQIKFISALMAGADVYVSLTGCFPGGSARGPVFGHVKKNRAKLTAAANKAGARVFVREIPSGSASGFRAGLFSSADADQATDDGFSVTITRASNMYEECDDIALQIKEMLETGFCRAGEIGVFVRDEKYVPCLVSSLKKTGVPVFEDRRRPLFSYPLARLILSAVSLAAKGFDTGDVFSFLKTDIAGIGEEDYSLLENYVYRWQINGKQWERDFNENPSGFGELFDDAAKQTLERINGIRRKIIQPVLRLRSALQKRNGRDACLGVYTFLKEIDAGENYLAYAEYLYSRSDEAGAADCAKVWDGCMSALDALADAAGGSDISPVYFYELLTLILSGTSIGDIPAGNDQVKIGTADRARFLSPAAVFAAGFTSAAYPAFSSGQSVFTGRDIRKLFENELDLEALPEDVFEEERLIAYNMLTCAEKTVRISWPALMPSGEKGEISPFADEVQKAFPSAVRRDAAASPALDRICSADSAFSVYASVMDEDSVFSESLKAALEGAGFGERIKALERAVRGAEDCFTDPSQAVRLFGKNMYFSASKAETYAKCPFMFFCRYGIGAQAITQSGLDVRINGLLVHKVLEDILLKHSDEKLGEISDEQLKNEISSSVNDYALTFMGGAENLSPAVARSLERAEKVIFEILLRIREEMNSCSFKTVAAELKIGGENADVPAYSLTLPDGGTVKLGGSIDRVDIMESGEDSYVRVVDYKTGGKEFRLSDVYYGLNMQMLLYLFAVCSSPEARFGELIPAGVLYVPANNSGTKLGRRASEEEIKRQKFKNGRMNGIILRDADVIKGMESAARGIYINAEIAEDGTLKGNLLTLDEFALLHKKTDEMLRKTGMNIHLGSFPALPIDLGSGKSACDYCDYSAVCQKESGCEKREKKDLSHEEAKKLLYGEEEQI